jgi:hypothetical protein
MSNVNTTVTVTAQAQGFAQAQQSAAKFTTTLSQGLKSINFKDFKKEVGDLEKSLKSIAKQQLELNDAIEAMGGLKSAPKDMADEMKRLEEAAGKAHKRVGLLNSAHSEHAKKRSNQERASGSFTQGFLQSAVPGAGLIERGPGAWRQAAGTMAGNSAKNVVGGIGSTPWAGAQGVAQALNGIPVVGGAAAGLLQQSMGYSGQALSYAKQRMGADPFMSAMDRGERSQMHRRGLKAGMDITETDSFAEQISRRGGGRGQDLQSQGMIEAAISAHRFGGIDAGTSGAFLQAGRRGGLESGREGDSVLGKGGQAMTEVMADGIALGLEGSELQEYMGEVASGIEQWKHTGIPIAPRSIADMTKDISSGAGMDATRAHEVAKSATSYAQRIAKDGPDSASDFLFAEKAMGFTPGSGAEGVREMRLRAEGKGEGGAGINAKGLMDYSNEMLGRGGGGARSQLVLQDTLAKNNINMGMKEIMDMDEIRQAKEGGTMTSDMQSRLDAIEAKFVESADKANAYKTQEGRDKAVAEGTPGALVEQAALANKQLAVGQRMLEATQKFETATLSMVNGVSTLLNPAVTGIAKGANAVAKVLEALAQGKSVTEAIVVGSH